MKPIRDFDGITNPSTNTPKLCAIALLKAFDGNVMAARKAIAFAGANAVATSKGLEDLCKGANLDVDTAKKLIFSDMLYLSAITDILIRVQKEGTAFLKMDGDKTNKMDDLI